MMKDIPEQGSDTPHEEEGPYRAFFEFSTDAMFIGNPDGSVIDVNAAWLDLFGYTRDELQGFSIADAYVNQEDRQRFLQSMLERGVCQDEIRFRRRDGSEFDCERTSIALRNDRGEPTVFQGIMRDITWRREHERALTDSQERYRALFENTMDAVALVSPGGLILEANPAYLDLFGYTTEDIGTLNVEEQYVNEEERTTFLERIATQDSIIDDEVHLKRRDGTVMDCLRNVFVRRDANGHVLGEQSVIRDVTKQKRAEHELRESEQGFRSLFEQSMDAIYIVDYDGSHMKVNRAWLELFGYTAEEVEKLNILALYAKPEERTRLLREIVHTGVVADEVKFKKKDGTVFDCARTVAARKDAKGNVVAFQGIMRDVTEQKRAYDELERLARYDTLTGLLNRRAVLERLAEWLRHVERYKGHFCVIMLDLDHFKRVNDDYGHQTGDHVLAKTADILRQSVRQTDVVGRYGGEEFLVLLPRTNRDGAGLVAERIRHFMGRTPMEDGRGGSFTITVSLGIASRRDGDQSDSLVNRADGALYTAKNEGRNRVEIAEE